MDFNIAIDGPAGAGKSTVAREVAKRLNMIYVDTGAMYRAITLLAMKHKKNSASEIAQLAGKINIELRDDRVYVNGEDVTDDIRDIGVTKRVSEVSKISGVRYHMTEFQRKMAQDKGAILDGRDIGTIVLPAAEYKFFLIADIDIRARRRFDELVKRGADVEFSQVKEDILKRDMEDSHRSCSPLSKAEDAIIVDTTGLNIDDVVNAIIRHIV